MTSPKASTTVQELQKRFTQSKEINFDEGQGGLARCNLKTEAAEASIYLHGAHLTSFKPTGGEELLFMSEASWYEVDKPIRGGVPICMPWFGPKPDNADAPNHGFFRLLPWEVESAAPLPDGRVQLHLSLESSDATRAYWPHDFHARFTLTIGTTLDMALTFKNTDDQALTITQALHTYFKVNDVNKVRVLGVENASYISKTEGGQLSQQPEEPLRFTKETDRVFVDNDATTTLVDPGLDREIVIEKSGSNSTVVWNPWIDKSAAMPDFGDDEWPQMVCIETANALQNAITVEPGKSHTIRATISINPTA